MKANFVKYSKVGIRTFDKILKSWYSSILSNTRIPTFDHYYFKALYCQIVAELCETKNCSGHGTCEDATGRCNCTMGYLGENCDSKLSKIPQWPKIIKSQIMIIVL